MSGKIRILCYGDSNTWGHNPEHGKNGFRYADTVRWTGVLQSELAGKATVIEEGLCGRTIMFDDPVSPDRDGRQFLSCCIQSQQPLDLVIFMLGTNDVRHIFTPSVQEIAMGMQNLVCTALDPMNYWAGSPPQVLVITPPPIRGDIACSEFYGMYDEESVKKSKLLQDEYQKVFAEMSGVSLIDAGPVAEVSKKDCIHLTSEGHHALGLTVAEWVRQQFNL